MGIPVLRFSAVGWVDTMPNSFVSLIHGLIRAMGSLFSWHDPSQTAWISAGNRVMAATKGAGLNLGCGQAQSLLALPCVGTT